LDDELVHGTGGEARIKAPSILRYAKDRFLM
jgi:hypothetical protein